MPVYTEELEEHITIEPNGNVTVDTFTITFKDGVPIGKSPPHAVSLNPGAVTDKQSDNIKAITAAVWTPEVIAKRKEVEAANIAAAGS